MRAIDLIDVAGAPNALDLLRPMADRTFWALCFAIRLSFNRSGLVWPMQIKARILDCPESDEHIVRRLGKAVVVLWDDLPRPIQDQIAKQAALMHDRHRALQLRHKIRAFIQIWKTIE
jgi:hypothetical protein